MLQLPTKALPSPLTQEPGPKNTTPRHVVDIATDSLMNKQVVG